LGEIKVFVLCIAVGVLMGGILADRTSRLAQVATIGLMVVAVLTFVIGTYDLGGGEPKPRDCGSRRPA
jgi:predicted MFS family arabinose efflux permease